MLYQRSILIIVCEKYNKPLKTLPFHMKYAALCESLVTNIALNKAKCYKFVMSLSPHAVYSIQAGGSALSNT